MTSGVSLAALVHHLAAWHQGLGSGAGVEESAVLTVCLGLLSPGGQEALLHRLYLHVPFVNSLET